MKETKYLPVWIDDKLQPEFKAHCARNRLHMKTVVEELIKEFMRDEKSKKEKQ